MTQTRSNAAAQSASTAPAALQRSATRTDKVCEVPPIVYDVISDPGQPLDESTRAYFEPRFGADFSNVRVHTGKKAAESAEAVNAKAYTVGDNVVFGSGSNGLASSPHPLRARIGPCPPTARRDDDRPYCSRSAATFRDRSGCCN